MQTQALKSISVYVCTSPHMSDLGGGEKKERKGCTLKSCFVSRISKALTSAFLYTKFGLWILFSSIIFFPL